MAAIASIDKMEELEKMKVTDLKKELKIRGLSTLGNKGDLLERLQLSLHAAGADVGIEEDVNEDDVLGDVDEILADDHKGDSSLALTEEEILSPTIIKSPPRALQIRTSAPCLIRKKTAAAVTPIVPTTTTTTTTAEPLTTPLVADTKAEIDAKVSPVVVKSLSTQERIELRAKRFNAPGTDDNRKQARAERFGVQGKTSGSLQPTNGASIEKLQQRAERFGQVISPSIKQLEEKDRLLKRKERFGAIVVASGKVDTNDKKIKRAERFGLK